MMLIRWLLNAIMVILVTYIVPGISVKSFYTALIVALIYGILNAIIRPILVILTLPINLITMGLFTLVINAGLFWLVSSIVKGFEIASFWSAFFGALVLWLISFITNAALKSAKASK